MIFGTGSAFCRDSIIIENTLKVVGMVTAEYTLIMDLMISHVFH